MSFTDPLWETTIHWTFNGRKCANVLHHRQILDTAPVEPQTVLSGWINGTLIPAMANLMSVAATYNAYTVKKLGPGVALEPIPYSPTQGTGILNGDPLPGNVALCFTKRSGFAGRKYRGRFFLGGLVEDQTSGNTFDTGTYAVELVALVGALKATVAGAFKPVVTGRVWNDAHTQWEGVDVVDVILRDNTLDSQRGRLRGP